MFFVLMVWVVCVVLCWWLCVIFFILPTVVSLCARHLWGVIFCSVSTWGAYPGYRPFTPPSRSCDLCCVLSLVHVQVLFWLSAYCCFCCFYFFVCLLWCFLSFLFFLCFCDSSSRYFFPLLRSSYLTSSLLFFLLYLFFIFLFLPTFSHYLLIVLFWYLLDFLCLFYISLVLSVLFFIPTLSTVLFNLCRSCSLPIFPPLI